MKGQTTTLFCMESTKPRINDDYMLLKLRCAAQSVFYPSCLHVDFLMGHCYKTTLNESFIRFLFLLNGMI